MHERLAGEAETGQRGRREPGEPPVPADGGGRQSKHVMVDESRDRPPGGHPSATSVSREETPVRLTDKDGERSALGMTAKWIISPPWAVAVIVAGLLGVFLIDRASGAVPFQHLYYLPVVFAALQFGRRGAWAASIAAVALYHLANPALLAFAHEERDVVQVVLFVVVGVVTARLREDAIRLEALAGTDDLTGLHNLRAFERLLRCAVRSSRETGAPLSLLVLDLDGLKALNDEHGHLAGAEAVRTVGHIIASHLPPGGFACRYGGDEFVVAIPGRAGPAADRIADGSSASRAQHRTGARWNRAAAIDPVGQHRDGTPGQHGVSTRRRGPRRRPCGRSTVPRGRRRAVRSEARWPGQGLRRVRVRGKM